MKVFTSYFANVTTLKKCGVVPISIARWSPRNWTGERMLWLAPTPYMLSDNCTRDEYIRLYKEICNRVNIDLFVKELNRIGNGNDVALLCYERPGDFCHRHILAEHLKSLGLEVTEFNGILYETQKSREQMEAEQTQPKKPSPEQLSLF